MNTATKEQQPVEHTFAITCLVDPFWVEYLTRFSDIFGQQYTGYWAHGADRNPQLGWLVFEHNDKEPDVSERKRVAALWRAGKDLPPRWYRLDRAAALRAWEEGVKRWGVNWYDDVDSTREDVVVQLALLGEVRYG